MATILAFAGSNSSTSINYQLVKHTVSLLQEHEVQLLNMTNYPFPMYSEDYERQKGYSNSLVELRDDIKSKDGLIIAVNEHNGNPSAYFKNVIDWLSRLDRKFLENKKILLMSTSRGKRGALSSLEIVKSMLPRFGAEIVATFSLPSFGDSFRESEGIVDTELSKAHRLAVDDFLSKIS